MSRSFKKHPVSHKSRHNGYRSKKLLRRVANKRVRRTTVLPDGGSYKKLGYWDNYTEGEGRRYRTFYEFLIEEDNKRNRRFYSNKNKDVLDRWEKDYLRK